ncbi:2169_t:CDS:2 [Funneliformis mosseae]|uniref:2169_t:CDS:1 n=1 Tax=Funneliformis mosseae TaxID=27381 RepID=A0A9N8Z2F2_FUNMO|nr:2169_t:CDS:2 [Funneliformis mosseae]
MAFLRKLVQSHSFHFPLSHLFLRFKYKTHFIPKIEALRAPATLSLGPRRFGKTLFLSTLSSYYDVKNRERFKQLFQGLYIGKNPTPLTSEFLVLELNLLDFALTEQLRDHFQDVDENRNVCEFPEIIERGDINSMFASMNTMYERSPYKPNTPPSSHQSSQKRSILKTACDGGITRVFLTGVTPVAMAEFTSGFNISVDLTLDEEFWDLYGFKKTEIEILLDKAFGNNLSDNIKEKIMSWLKEETMGIFFTPNSSPASLQHSFRIPNLIAEREFIAEALKIYDWRKEDLIPVRNCLQILEAEYNIEPLCRFIEKALLKPLKDNSFKHSNEEALKQAFMDTLILILHADIEPEFQVYSQSSNFGGKAIDLVKSSTGKMIAIEFDNIKMENVKLDGARGSWQEATDVSRSFLEIGDKYRPNQKTVREALESKIKKKSNEYLDPLKNQHDAELSYIKHRITKLSFAPYLCMHYTLLSNKFYFSDDIQIIHPTPHHEIETESDLSDPE